jgi:hypothetical protein
LHNDLDAMMTGPAAVHSIELLQEWHAALCIFRTEAMESLSAIALEIQRTDAWLDEKLRGWQREARDAEELVVRYKAELANRRFPDFSGRIPDCSLQEENLLKAERRLEYARDQIDIVHRWYTRMPKLVEEASSAPSRHLANFLEGELPRALAVLTERIRSLEAYVNVQPQQVAAPKAPGKESS